MVSYDAAYEPAGNWRPLLAAIGLLEKKQAEAEGYAKHKISRALEYLYQQHDDLIDRMDRG